METREVAPLSRCILLALGVYAQWDKDGKPDDFDPDALWLWQKLRNTPLPDHLPLPQLETGNFSITKFDV